MRSHLSAVQLEGYDWLGLSTSGWSKTFIPPHNINILGCARPRGFPGRHILYMYNCREHFQ